MCVCVCVLVGGWVWDLWVSRLMFERVLGYVAMCEGLIECVLCASLCLNAYKSKMILGTLKIEWWLPYKQFNETLPSFVQSNDS